MSFKRDKKKNLIDDFRLEELFENEEEKEKFGRMNEIQKETFVAEKRHKKLEELQRENLRKSKFPNEERKLSIPQQDSKKKRNNIRSDDSFNSEYESGEIRKNSSSSSDYEDADDSSSEAMSLDSDDNPKKPLSQISMNDIQKILIRRTFIEKNYDLPMFDSTIKDAFVKINMSAGRSSANGYLLGQIKAVIDMPDKPYKFMGKQITKYLSVSHATSNKNFTYFVISNSPLTEQEFQTWYSRMEKNKCDLPSVDRINEVYSAIRKISEKSFTKEELMKIISLKKESKLKNQDRNMNITHELAGLEEQYNAAFQKFTEAKDPSIKAEYELKVKEIFPKLELMRKIAAEREEEDFKKFENDTVAIINKKNREKQKLNDMKNSLLNRKKQRQNISNQYKRKDCAPVNLFDSGYLNKKVKNETKPSEEEKNIDEEAVREEQKTFGLNKAELLRNLEENILGKSDELDQIFSKRKSKIDGSLTEKDPIFTILPIDETLVLNLLNQNNSKINLNDSKRYSLNDIDI